MNESLWSVVGIQPQGQVGRSGRAHVSWTCLQVLPTQTPKELLSIL